MDSTADGIRKRRLQPAYLLNSLVPPPLGTTYLLHDLVPPPLGTTYLFDELVKHPRIRGGAEDASSSKGTGGEQGRWNGAKEPQFFNKMMLPDFDDYLAAYSRSGWVGAKQVKENGWGQLFICLSHRGVPNCPCSPISPAPLFPCNPVTLQGALVNCP